MSDGAKSPPIGVVIDTRIEDGDRGDEDVNSQTPQTATIALSFGEPLPIIYGCERVSTPTETTYAINARAMAPLDNAGAIDESSDLYAISKGMKGMAQGAEADARLHGLMAILSLPLVREGRVHVQVEVLPNTWERIDGVSIEPERITFSRGTNGHAIEWRFLAIEGVPAWRTVSLTPKRHELGHE